MIVSPQIRSQFLCFMLLFLGFLTLPAVQAVEVSDSLREGKLSDAWLIQKSDKGKPAFAITPEGLAIKAEMGLYTSVRRRNESVGTDRNPLVTSCGLWTDNGAASPATAMVLYWDNNNYIFLPNAWDNNYNVHWRLKGVDSSRSFANVVPDSKTNGIYVRAALTTHNCFIDVSPDGANWRSLTALGFRPQEGVAPGSIIVGRCHAGQMGETTAKPEMANDLNPNNQPAQITSIFRDFTLRDTTTVEVTPLELQAKEDWDKTVESLELVNLPRAWTLLGPRPDQGFKLFNQKEGLSPDSTDDWQTTPLLDEAGKPFRKTAWTRPDDDAGTYLDLGEILEPNTHVLAYARTEVDWPVSGSAILWTDYNGRERVFANNRYVFGSNDRNPEAAEKDRHSLPVIMKKGRNVIKIKSAQSTGPWGFFLRLERTDPGYRIQVLEKLLELHPNDATDWHGAQALLEIARQQEGLFQFEKASATWQRVIETFSKVDEYREEALERRLRMFETLRDWSGLLEAGEQYLAKFPVFSDGEGSQRAFQKCVLAEYHLKKFPAAETRVAKFVEQAGTSGRQVLLAWRTLAGAAEECGESARQYAALEKLSDAVAVNKTERAKAAFEAAFLRCGAESKKATSVKPDKLDAANLIAACAIAQKGLALLFSGAGAGAGVFPPQVQSWVQEAEADLKAGRHERAVAGFWGAALMATCASDAEAAPVLTLNKSYKLPALNIDPATKKPRDFSDPIKQEATNILSQLTNEASWLGKGWKAIGPFENADDAGMHTAFGPETSADLTKRHPGRGGEKSWVDVDPKAVNEYGQDLKVALGDCRNGVVYVSREFECSAARTANLYLATQAGWGVWLDGQIVGSKIVDSYYHDRMPISLKLTAGKHRLLLKLAVQGDTSNTFRVRVSDEPELAVNLLKIAWLQREFPAVSRFYGMQNEIYGLLVATRLMRNGAAVRTCARALESAYPDNNELSCAYSTYALERQWEFGEYDAVVAGLRSYLLRLDIWPEVQSRGLRVWWATNLLNSALLAQGDSSSADAVLKTYISRFPECYAETGTALSLRGMMRRDFSIAQASRPYFERLLRDYPNSCGYSGIAGLGLYFSKNYQHERVQFETSSEAQAAVEAAARQFKTGNAQDVERAMRNLGEAISNGAKGMVRVSDSRTAPLYVGVREYFRALLRTLSDELRDTYLKTVAETSRQHYEAAAAFDDIPALEAVGSDFYYTPAAMAAFNRVGNLYMDRGAWGQASAAFKYLLQEYKHVEGFNEPMTASKCAFALFQDGQYAAARQALEALLKEHGAKTLCISGQSQTVSQFAQGLLNQIAKASVGRTPLNGSIGTGTYAGDSTRNGASLNAPAPRPGEVLWAQNLTPSPASDRGRAWWIPDPFTHLQSYPVVSGNKAFFGTQESLRAVDLLTGQPLWSQNWASTKPSTLSAFQGFAICCPTVSNDKIYMRVLNHRQSVLNCFDAESGRLLWSTECIPELKRTLWSSDPLVAFGLVLASYLETGDTNMHGVAAFDLQTGRMRWKTVLVSGSTGPRVGTDFIPTTLYLGPPAGARGVIYAATGLNSLVALNALSGEVIWLAGYPRIQVGLHHDGFSGNAGGSIRNQVLKLFARGPASPVVTDEVVILAPRDALGLIAFDRKSGHVRWTLDLADNRFVAGVCENKILLVDNNVKALDVNTGSLAWEYELREEMLYGQPGYSGGILYLPGEDKMTLLDARTGRLICSQPWDSRTGPIANLVITPNLILGVSETQMVGIGPEGSAKKELAFEEAKQAEAAGNWELAADRYGRALRLPHSDDLPACTSGWVRVMEKLNKKAEALAALDGLLQDKPDMLTSAAGVWCVAKSTFLGGLRARLGQPPSAVVPIPNELGGSLAYAWQIEGENPRTFYPKTGPQDRFFACVGSTLYCIKYSAQLEILWQNYVGPDVVSFNAGPTAVAVASAKKLIVLDYNTGEQLWRAPLPTPTERIRKKGKRQPFRNTQSGFGSICMDENSVVVTAGSSLFCYDLLTGAERWSNDFVHRKTQYLAFINGNLSEFYSTELKNRHFAIWDAATGGTRKHVSLGAGNGWSHAVVSPDEKLFIARFSPAMIYALDVATGNKVWETAVPAFNVGYANWMCLRIVDDCILFNGGVDGVWSALFLNLSDGKIINRVTNGGLKSGNGYMFSDGKLIARTNDDGKGNLKESWKVFVADQYSPHQNHVKSFVSKNRLYSLYIKNTQQGRDQYVLRTADWETGQVLKNEPVPGTVNWGYGHSIPNPVEQRGNLLLYIAVEGLYAYAPLGNGLTASDSGSKLHEKIKDPNLSAVLRRETRRALAALDPQMLQAFLLPEGSKAGDWSGSDPLLLQAPQNYMPLTDDPALKTPQDLSAKVYAGWNATGVVFAVDVLDDKFVPPGAGALLESGDGIRIDLNAFTDPYTGFSSENISCNMALVDGLTVIRVSPETDAEPENAVSGTVTRSSDGRGVHYEVFLPWTILRRDPAQRPGMCKELRVGIAVFDDDGAGVKGAVEWGAAVTSPTLAPMRLGQLSLLDISLEKIERYRKIIAQLPDAPESLQFMDLILLSKRGPAANQDRIAELEAYIKAHPSAAGAHRILSQLCGYYQTRGEADPIGKTLEFARAAKCPASTLENIKNKAVPAAGATVKSADPKAAALYRDAALLLPDSPEGLVFFRRMLEQFDVKSATYTTDCMGEIEKYLQAHPSTQHATALLQMLRVFDQIAGSTKPSIKCEELMFKVKLSRDNCRAFYSSFIPAWTEYHVIGPFHGVGDRRGLETVLPPEKAVDLTWTTKAFGDIEQKWEKHSFAKGDKGKPNESGIVSLDAVVSAKLDGNNKKELHKVAYFAYAYVKFNVPTKRRAILLYGANEMLSIWVNGQRKVTEALPGNVKDHEIKEVQLSAGVNEILIKVGVNAQNLSFFFRIADENGRPFDDVTFP